jgi:hypothetical protein
MILGLTQKVKAVYVRGYPRWLAIQIWSLEILGVKVEKIQLIQKNLIGLYTIRNYKNVQQNLMKFNLLPFDKLNENFK